MTEAAADPDTTITTLGNGVRVVSIALPHVDTAAVSVFIRSGSQHESLKLNGISHFAEHMAFKGTADRDCQRINLDAERLGAEVNAHTDKDHTAYHMVGLAEHAGAFVRMLADIVRNGIYPEAELERERQVILQELAEDEDDGLANAYRMFDKLCYGEHALAQPVIGTQRNIKHFSRAELMEYVRRQYTGANVIVGVAGNVDAQRFLAEAQAAFGDMAEGSENVVAAPAYLGGMKTRRLPGGHQTHVVLGFPIAALKDEPHPAIVAAALFGEGMSSPLMDEIRERRGLVYYAACSADVLELGGQFIVEASMAAENVDKFFGEVTRLLHAQAASIEPVDLQRARNQIAVRQLRARERPTQRLEAAALDLFAWGRVRSRGELRAGFESVSAEQVRDAFAGMLGQRAAVALAGSVSKHVEARIARLFDAAHA